MMTYNEVAKAYREATESATRLTRWNSASEAMCFMRSRKRGQHRSSEERAELDMWLNVIDLYDTLMYLDCKELAKA